MLWLFFDRFLCVESLASITQPTKHSPPEPHVTKKPQSLSIGVFASRQKLVPSDPRGPSSVTAGETGRSGAVGAPIRAHPRLCGFFRSPSAVTSTEQSGASAMRSRPIEWSDVKSLTQKTLAHQIPSKPVRTPVRRLFFAGGGVNSGHTEANWSCSWT